MAVDNLPIATGNTYALRSLHLQSLHSWVHDPQIMQQIYKQYGNGFLMLDFLRSLNRVTSVADEQLITAERPYMHRTVTLGSSVTISSDEQIIFDLDASDVDSSGRYYPREKFVITFGSTASAVGLMQAIITDISTGGANVLITAKRLNASAPSFNDLDGEGMVSTGQEVAIGDSAFGTETGQPNPTSLGVVQRTHYSQIFKEALKFGGQELAKSSYWIDLQGDGWYNMELARAEFLLDLQLEMALVMGQTNTKALVDTTDDGDSVPINKNKGVWTWIDELGGDVNYTGVGGFAITDLDSVSTYLKSKGITETTCLLLAGDVLMKDIENEAVDYVQGSGGLPYTFTDAYGDGMLSGKPNMLLNIGFKAIKKGGILFLLAPMNLFDNPYLMGISDYMLNAAGMVIPITTVKDVNSGLNIPNLSARYRGLGSYSRERVVGNFAGMDGYMQQKYGYPAISEIDQNKTHWLSEMMFPFVEAYKGLLIKRTS